MDISINKRKLTQNEMVIIDQEIKKFSNPVYFSKSHWNEIHTAYIASINGSLAGICSFSKTGHWYKLGPFIVFEKYQGKGIGKQILRRIDKENSNNSLFIGSRNKNVWSLAKKLGFKEETHIWKLAIEIKLYLLKSLLWVFDIDYLKELLRKKSIQEGPFKIFIKPSFSPLSD